MRRCLLEPETRADPAEAPLPTTRACLKVYPRCRGVCSCYFRISEPRQERFEKAFDRRSQPPSCPAVDPSRAELANSERGASSRGGSPSPSSLLPRTFGQDARPGSEHSIVLWHLGARSASQLHDRMPGAGVDSIDLRLRFASRGTVVRGWQRDRSIYRQRPVTHLPFQGKAKAFASVQAHPCRPTRSFAWRTGTGTHTTRPSHPSHYFWRLFSAWGFHLSPNGGESGVGMLPTSVPVANRSCVPSPLVPFRSIPSAQALPL